MKEVTPEDIEAVFRYESNPNLKEIRNYYKDKMKSVYERYHEHMSDVMTEEQAKDDVKEGGSLYWVRLMMGNDEQQQRTAAEQIYTEARFVRKNGYPYPQNK